MEIRKEIGNILDSLIEDQAPQQTLPPGLYRTFIIPINSIKEKFYKKLLSKYLLYVLGKQIYSNKKPKLRLIDFHGLEKTNSILRGNILSYDLKEYLGFLNPKPIPIFDGLRSSIKESSIQNNIDNVTFQELQKKNKQINKKIDIFF